MKRKSEIKPANPLKPGDDPLDVDLEDAEFIGNKVDVLALMRHTQGNRSTTAFAESLNCSTAYLSDVYNGKRTIGPKLLNALNLEKKTVYVKRWR